MARSRGTRPFIRSVVACAACGAQPGERCRAYVHRRGKTVGNPTEDVHAARWAAFRAWSDQRAAARLSGCGARPQWVVYDQAPVIPARCIGVPELPAEYFDCG